MKIIRQEKTYRIAKKEEIYNLIKLSNGLSRETLKKMTGNQLKTQLNSLIKDGKIKKFNAGNKRIYVDIKDENINFENYKMNEMFGDTIFLFRESNFILGSGEFDYKQHYHTTAVFNNKILKLRLVKVNADNYVKSISQLKDTDYLNVLVFDNKDSANDCLRKFKKNLINTILVVIDSENITAIYIDLLEKVIPINEKFSLNSIDINKFIEDDLTVELLNKSVKSLANYQQMLINKI